MQKLIRRREVNDDDLPLCDGLHPLLARVYAGRGVHDGNELDLSLARLLPPDRLSRADEAARLLADALAIGQSILVVGDYDADGATSTALALRALRALGAAQVDYLVPNRFEYGYGLTPEIVALALRSGQPDISSRWTTVFPVSRVSPPRGTRVSPP